MSFRLHSQEQVFYTLPDLAASTPAGAASVLVTGWQASFDGGTTWTTSVAHPDLPTAPAWLIRGPGHPGTGDSTPSTGILVSRSVRPLVRLLDTPETDIEPTDEIRLWT